MTKPPPTDPETERLAMLKAAKALVGDDEPTSAKEAFVIDEVRAELPRVDRSKLIEAAKRLAKRK